MDVRSMPEIKEIVEFLKNMEFKKKAVGGCDQEDVLDHMDRVVRMYHNVVESLNDKLTEEKNRGDHLEKEYLRKIKKLDIAIEELDQTKEDVVFRANSEAGEILQEAQRQVADEHKRLEELQQQRISFEAAYQKQVQDANEAYRKYCQDLQRYYQQGMK